MCAVLQNGDFIAKSCDFSNNLGDFFSCQKRLATNPGNFELLDFLDVVQLLDTFLLLGRLTYCSSVV